MQARLDRMPDAMGVRRQTVEHPFGTLKAWMGATHFLTRTLDNRDEPPRPGLQPQANDQDLRSGTADGGDHNLIASLKPPVPIDQPPSRPSWPGSTARRPRRMTRFSTASNQSGASPFRGGVPTHRTGGMFRDLADSRDGS